MDPETLELFQSKIDSNVNFIGAETIKTYIMKEVKGQFCLLHDNIRGYWVHFSRITLFTANFDL